MEETNIITIENLIASEHNQYVNFDNKLVISDVTDLSLFKYPCHLKAITILICVDGELDGSINLNTYHIEASQALINFPENIIHIHKTNNLRAIAVIISTEYLIELSLDYLSYSRTYLFDMKKNEGFGVDKCELSHWLDYIELIKHTITSRILKTNQTLIKHTVSSFMINTILLYHEHLAANNLAKNEMRSKSSTIILNHFFELVVANHSRERTVRFYADKMCITCKHLSMIVKRETGKKPLEWISEYVILEAKSLLKYSGKNIQEISYQLNFPTQSAFGKYFKSFVGISPSEYAEREMVI